jgi:DNA-binding transcriptional LysR family regulator
MINMDLNNIRAFVTVADTGSFSLAADLLYITQPAVSKRVAAMEHSLSTKLFDRIGRRIILTEAGNTILSKCRLILDTIDDTTKVIHNLSGQVTGTLSIGTSHHIGLHHLPPVIREYVRLYPDVEMDIHFLSSEQVCDMVISGDLELGIITLPDHIRENLSIKALWHDQMHFVVNNQHGLSKLSKCKIQQLMEFNAILPERGTFTHSIIEQEFKKNGLELKSKIATNYMETIKMMVSVGLGWSVLPESLIDKDLKSLKIDGFKFSRELGVIQHKQRTLTNAAIAMTSVLNETNSD